MEIKEVINETAETYKGKSEGDLKIMLCEFALKVIGITADKISAGFGAPAKIGATIKGTSHKGRSA